MGENLPDLEFSTELEARVVASLAAVQIRRAEHCPKFDGQNLVPYPSGQTYCTHLSFLSNQFAENYTCTCTL